MSDRRTPENDFVPDEVVAPVEAPSGSESETQRARERAPRAEGHPDKVYVLDTSVLLSDPGALGRFAEHEVVLPLVVITELEGKRHHPELGWFARQTLRMLDDLRVRYGRLDVPVPVNDAGGLLRIELNHVSTDNLPIGFRAETNDARILAVALNLAADGRDVVLVTKDVPLRVKAGAVGLNADEYRAEMVSVAERPWTGMVDLDVSDDEMARLYGEETIDLASAQ
jgi:PhoH-like ATPase